VRQASIDANGKGYLRLNRKETVRAQNARNKIGGRTKCPAALKRFIALIFSVEQNEDP
jgi:hypothetical protein